MEHINADMEAIIAIANDLDYFQAELVRLQNQLQGHFEGLWHNGDWTDVNFRKFHTTHMETLATELQLVHTEVNHELKPFLNSVYHKLVQYRDS